MKIPNLYFSLCNCISNLLGNRNTKAIDLEVREAILKVHAKGKTSCPDVNFTRLALQTCGLSGAALEG